MIFTDIISFIYVILFIIVYNSCTRLFKGEKLASLLLLIGNIVVLSTITTVESIGILLVVSACVYFASRFLSKNNSKFYLALFIGILLSLFVIKNYKIADLALLHRVGLSYILFRLIHFLVDSSKNKIQDYRLSTFLNYIIFFPNFIAGPIDEYNNFNYWTKQKRTPYNWVLMKAGTFRLLLGIVKKFFLVPLIINYALDFSSFENTLMWQQNLMISLFFYSFYILFDFSGYSDIAIGTAYLIGIKTPENFNNPYFSSNLSVFWKKWHMTFSNFLFKYVFKPTVTNLSALLKNSPRLFVSSLGYFITFIICGIWHGNTLNFVYWGMWHGVGLVFFKLWDTYVFQKYILKTRSLIFKTIYKIAAIAFTFIFVTFGWFFFNYNTGEITMILSNLTMENAKEINVSTVNFDNKLYYQIVFENNDSEFVDIEYRTTEQDRFDTHHRVKAEKNNTFYIAPALNANKTPTHIRIRPSSKNEDGKWYASLCFLDGSISNQTMLEKTIFGTKTRLVTLQEKPENVLVGSLHLPSEYLLQSLATKSLFIENYGWSMEVHYLPYPGGKVDVHYRRENGEWTKYQENRDGKYDFIHIHGENEYEKTRRNLAPGNYEVRIRYSNGYSFSKWLISKAIIPDYVNS